QSLLLLLLLLEWRTAAREKEAAGTTTPRTAPSTSAATPPAAPSAAAGPPAPSSSVRIVHYLHLHHQAQRRLGVSFPAGRPAGRRRCSAGFACLLWTACPRIGSAVRSVRAVRADG